MDFNTARYDRSSMVWKGIMNSAHLLTDTTYWSIGKGHNIYFWTHKWISDVGVLTGHSLVPLSDEDLKKKVADFVVNSDWNLDVLRDLLPENIIQCIVGIHTPLENSGEDKCVWNLTPSSIFSLKSMTNFLAGSNHQTLQQQ